MELTNTDAEISTEATRLEILIKRYLEIRNIVWQFIFCKLNIHVVWLEVKQNLCDLP